MRLRALKSELNTARLDDIRWQKTDQKTGLELSDLVEFVRPKGEVNDNPVMTFRALPDFDNGQELPWHVQTEFGDVPTNWLITFNAACWVGVDQKISFWLEEEFMDDAERAWRVSPYGVLQSFLRPIRRDPTALPAGFRTEWLSLFRTRQNQDDGQWQNFAIPNVQTLGLMRGFVVQKNSEWFISQASGQFVPSGLVGIGGSNKLAVIELPPSAARRLRSLYDLTTVSPQYTDDPVGLDAGVFFRIDREANAYNVTAQKAVTLATAQGRIVMMPQLSAFREQVLQKFVEWDRLLRFISYEEQAARLYQVLPADLLDMAWADYPDYRAQRGERRVSAASVPPQAQPQQPGSVISAKPVVVSPQPGAATDENTQRPQVTHLLTDVAQAEVPRPGTTQSSSVSASPSAQHPAQVGATSASSDVNEAVPFTPDPEIRDDIRAQLKELKKVKARVTGR